MVRGGVLKASLLQCGERTYRKQSVFHVTSAACSVSQRECDAANSSGFSPTRAADSACLSPFVRSADCHSPGPHGHAAGTHNCHTRMLQALCNDRRVLRYLTSRPSIG